MPLVTPNSVGRSAVIWAISEERHGEKKKSDQEEKKSENVSATQGSSVRLELNGVQNVWTEDG